MTHDPVRGRWCARGTIWPVVDGGARDQIHETSGASRVALAKAISSHDDGALTRLRPAKASPQRPPWWAQQPETRHQRRTRILRTLLVISDIVGLLVAMVLAATLPLPLEAFPAAKAETAFWISVCAIPLWLALLGRQKLYHLRFLVDRGEEWKRSLTAVIEGVAATVTLASLINSEIPGRYALALLPPAFLFVIGGREIIRFVLTRRSPDHRVRSVLVVGTNSEAVELARELDDKPSLGYRVLGFVTDGDFDSLAPKVSERTLGTVDETLDVVRLTDADAVVVATTAISVHESNRLVRQLNDAGIEVELTTSLFRFASERLTVGSVSGWPVMSVQPVLLRGWRSAVKRAIDVLIASIVLLVASIPMLVTAAAVRLTSPGPILFRQTRVGQRGEPFEVLKFRTMVVNAEELLIELRDQNEADGPLFKMANDPRITRIGGFLRASSIDELPQLINVLKGEMSLVGPRPALQSEVEQWEPELYDRLRVKPGITGMWQVNGRSDASFAQYVHHDLFYVENWSLKTDMSILARTIPAVIFRRGAA